MPLRRIFSDPHRLARQVKQFGSSLSGKLLHLPGEPAGVEEKGTARN
jgi:hypothetical protein